MKRLFFRFWNFYLQDLGKYIIFAAKFRRKAEVEKFGCLQPLKKMLKSLQTAHLQPSFWQHTDYFYDDFTTFAVFASIPGKPTDVDLFVPIYSPVC